MRCGYGSGVFIEIESSLVYFVSGTTRGEVRMEDSLYRNDIGMIAWNKKVQEFSLEKQVLEEIEKKINAL